MTKYLDPIAAVEQPRADFIRYLLTAYPLRDPHLRYGFKQLLEQPGNLWQHPYLEGSQPLRTSRKSYPRSCGTTAKYSRCDWYRFGKN